MYFGFSSTGEINLKTVVFVAYVDQELDPSFIVPYEPKQGTELNDLFPSQPRDSL